MAVAHILAPQTIYHATEVGRQYDLVHEKDISSSTTVRTGSGLIVNGKVIKLWTVDMLAEGTWIVGRYPTLSWRTFRTSTSMRIELLELVRPLTFCLASACSRTKTHKRFFSSRDFKSILAGNCYLCFRTRTWKLSHIVNGKIFCIQCLDTLFVLN